MKRVLILILAACLTFSGCSLFSDSYVSVTPHRDSSGGAENKVTAAANYAELRSAFVELVHSGAESGVIYVSDYDPEKLDQGLETAVKHVCSYDAIGAYAVESISYEKGNSGVVPAVAVTVQYLHNRGEMQQIQTVRDSDALWERVVTALERYEPGIVVYVESYTNQDLIQLVEDYGEQNPSKIMEVPQVSCELYPESGADRVVELKFTYQNSRTDLRQMQSQVQSIFNSAVLYASGGTEYQKLSRLYSYLLERFSEYQIKTSITPAYSLLHHGVGDSRAFAMVYAQMCRMAGVDAQIVTGTYRGEPWYWNMVESDGSFYHVDLLRSNAENGFRLYTDDRMTEYVWDYSAYPACEEAWQEEAASQESAENG